MKMNWLVFINKDFEPYRLQLNQWHNPPIPPEGLNGKDINGKEILDGRGKTMNAVEKTGTANKWCIPKLDNLPQNILDDADYEITKGQMVSEGFWEAVSV